MESMQARNKLITEVDEEVPEIMGGKDAMIEAERREKSDLMKLLLDTDAKQN